MKMIEVKFKDIIFRFAPDDLEKQYAIVNALIKKGTFTHFDGACCFRALRNAVYGKFATFFIQACAVRNTTRVRQVFAIDSETKESALTKACQEFCSSFPHSWTISAGVTTYEAYRRFVREVEMRKTLKTLEIE